MKDFRSSATSGSTKNLAVYLINGDQQFDCLVLGEPRQTSQIAINSLKSHVRLEVKSMGKLERRHGSISFPSDILVGAAKKKLNSHWITLFDDPQDDEYDGDFTEDDPEMPMVLFQFKKVSGQAKPKYEEF